MINKIKFSELFKKWVYFLSFEMFLCIYFFEFLNLFFCASVTDKNDTNVIVQPHFNNFGLI